MDGGAEDGEGSGDDQRDVHFAPLAGCVLFVSPIREPPSIRFYTTDRAAQADKHSAPSRMNT